MNDMVENVILVLDALEQECENMDYMDKTKE